MNSLKVIPLRDIRTSDSKLSQEILSLNLNEYNSIGKIKTTDNDNLIVSYTPKRAKKDEYNRTKGLKRLENAPADLFGQAAGVIRTVLK